MTDIIDCLSLNMSFGEHTFISNAFLLNDFWYHGVPKNTEDHQGIEVDQTWVALTRFNLQISVLCCDLHRDRSFVLQGKLNDLFLYET